MGWKKYVEFYELCDTDLNVVSLDVLLHLSHSGYTRLSFREIEPPVVAQDDKFHIQVWLLNPLTRVGISHLQWILPLLPSAQTDWSSDHSQYTLLSRSVMVPFYPPHHTFLRVVGKLSPPLQTSLSLQAVVARRAQAQVGIERVRGRRTPT